VLKTIHTRGLFICSLTFCGCLTCDYVPVINLLYLIVLGFGVLTGLTFCGCLTCDYVPVINLLYLIVLGFGVLTG